MGANIDQASAADSPPLMHDRQASHAIDPSLEYAAAPAGPRFRDQFTHLSQSLPPLPPPLSPRTMNQAYGFFGALTGAHLRPDPSRARSGAGMPGPYSHPHLAGPPLTASHAGSASRYYSGAENGTAADLDVPDDQTGAGAQSNHGRDEEDIDDDECMNRIQPLRRSLSIEREFNAYEGPGVS